MKSHLRILALLACALRAQAQGTIRFQAVLTGSSEVPPNSDPTTATGTFSLDGSLLSFRVDVPAVTFISVSGYIQGPALPGANGAVIFNLGAPVFHSGNSLGSPPFYSFGSPATPPFGAGPFQLTDAQIGQLEVGWWYENITSAAEPGGQLRGQILPVPEPSSFALLVAGAGLAILIRRRKA